MIKPQSMIIKICGIRCPKIAAQAIGVGAHWIGVVFAKRSRRLVDLKTAKAISMAVLDMGGTPVGVFENALSEEILTICKETGIRVVQIHGIQSILDSQFLPEEYQRIYALGSNAVLPEIPSCSPVRDFILFDGPCSGSGEKFNWSDFHYEGPYRWILSGGLTAKNIALGIHSLKPFGVDVSSGVENLKGEKTMKKINALIRAIR